MVDGILSVLVYPKASSSRIVIEGDKVKVYVTSPPTDGDANKSVIELLSKKLKHPKSKIVLISGAKSRAKKFQIVGLPQSELDKKLHGNN